MESLLQNRFLSKKLESINLPGYIFLSLIIKKQFKIDRNLFFCICKHLDYKIDLKNYPNYKSCKDYKTAVKNKHLFCLKFLHKTSKIIFNDYILEEISKYSLLKFLKYAHEQ